MSKQIRCVVSGVDDEGRSIWSSDGYPNTFLVRGGGARTTDVWRIPHCPPDIRDDHASPGNETWPDPTGLVFRTAEIPPRAKRGPGEEDSWKKGWHASETVDLMTMISGELWAYQSHTDEAILLKAGDTFIQRGSMHAWENRSDEPCLFSVVLVGATNKGAPVRGEGE